SAPPPVAGQAGGARIKLEAAALGRDRDQKRVPREHTFRGRAVDRARRAAGLALLAGAVDLHDGLRRGKFARGRHLLDERLDVRAQKLGRPVAGGADEMKMPWMAVRGLESRVALAEIDLSRDAGADHPLQRSIDGRAADARILAVDEVRQIVRARMPLLAEKD